MDARTQQLHDTMWNSDIPYKERVKQIKDAKTQLNKDAPIRLTIEQADEVIDALRWVDDDWENMDEAERITHKGMRDVFYAILDQYPIHTDAPK